METELGATPFDKLVHRTPEGIDLQPVYAGDGEPAAGYPGLAPLARGSRPLGTSAGWDICQRHIGAPDAVNESLRADLARGVTGAWLDVAASGWSAADLRCALDGVDVTSTALIVDGSDAEAIEVLASLGATNVALGVDPTADIGALAAQLREHLPAARMLVSARAYHDGGGHAVHDIGYAAATAACVLRALANAGWTVDDAAARVGLSFAIGRDIFTEIAKLRAARVVWATMLAASGASRPFSCWIHAAGSRRTLTRRDPWVNMLRATTQTFAAIIGGADSITSSAFDEAIGVPDVLGRRIARNTQIILGRESHLGEVVDPGGGSFYIEKLTDQLARAGWAKLQEIEAAGGIVAHLSSGAAAADIDAAWQERAKLLATRREAVTGVSEFANVAEERVERPASPARPSPIPAHRDAELFEALRDATDAAADRPSVFLANLGPLREHNARAGYARNFFAAAGLTAVNGEGATDAGALAAELSASGCTAACICGTDDRYAELAAGAAIALKEAGAKQIFVAGKVKDLQADLGAAGVDRFIHIGSDTHADLAWLLTELGVLS